MTTANCVDFSFIKCHFSLKQVELNRLIKDRCLGVSMDFCALFMIVSYIPFMTYLTFGKGELQTGIHILRFIYGCIFFHLSVKSISLV